jgi:homoserine O-succinyltransferase/O-acetyltransferase
VAVSLARPAGAEPARWTCALVNNMPDSAFESTEHQYLELLDAASAGRTLQVDRFALEGVPHDAAVKERIATEYRPMDELRAGRPDLLIVTGSNPVESEISREPYWDELAGVLEWGRAHVPSMLLSCLAAHAALAVFDGLERRELEQKCTGVFEQVAQPGHPLTAGMRPPMALPHSRLNTVGVGQVAGAGYQVALGSDEVGWTVATKVVDRSLVVVIQGHPEYGPSSLLREYQRDVRRYACHERDTLPCLPSGCVGPEDAEALAELHRRVVGGERDPALVEAFDFDQAGARAPWPWRDLAVLLYGNWLSGVPMRSD